MDRVSRRMRWPIAAVAAATLALPVGVAMTAWWWSRPTQPPLVDVLPVIDRGIASVVVAAGGEAAVAVAGINQVRPCALNRLRHGWQYARAADMYTDPGSEDALIGRIAGRLPTNLHPQREAPVGGVAAALVADLGNGVRLAVRQLGEGWLTAAAETDCHPAAVLPAASSPPPEVTAKLTRLLGHLGAAAARWETRTVFCPAGLITTTVAISQPADTAYLARRLADALPAGAREFTTSAANRWTYRDGDTSVIAAASDDATAITIRDTTSRC
jgi:hypothetical protein